jgi:chorismate-pyruvate lyase
VRPRPGLDDLVHRIVGTDSMTRALAAWTGRPVLVDVHARRAGRPVPAPVAAALDLPPGALVQRRRVSLRAGGDVVARAVSFVHLGSAALTPATRAELERGGNLGELLRPLGHRRRTLRVQRSPAGPGGDDPLLVVHAALSVGGTAVAWCEETILPAVLRLRAPHPDLAEHPGA